MRGENNDKPTQITRICQEDKEGNCERKDQTWMINLGSYQPYNQDTIREGNRSNESNY